MIRYTLVFLFSITFEHVLMLKKNRGPHIGKWNGIGGKIESYDKNEEEGAYREILEETGLDKKDIDPLTILVKEYYPHEDIELNVYYSKLHKYSEARQMESEPLRWFCYYQLLNVEDKNFAGVGNIPFYIQYARILDGKENL